MISIIYVEGIINLKINCTQRNRKMFVVISPLYNLERQTNRATPAPLSLNGGRQWGWIAGIS